MKISSIMTRRVVTVEMDDFLQIISEIFENVKFHHILVVDGRKLVGVISDRDFIKALSPFLDTPSEEKPDITTLNKKAHQIMNRTPNYCRCGN